MRIRVDFEIDDDVARHHWETKTREGFRAYMRENARPLLDGLVHDAMIYWNEQHAPESPELWRMTAPLADPHVKESRK